MKQFIATFVNDIGETKIVKITARALYEAESKFNQMAKQEGKIVEDILEV